MLALPKLIRIAALVAVVGGALAAAPARSAPPGTALAPGDIIQARRTTVYLDPLRLIPLPARAWHILYQSTSATGQPVAVSGTVLVPPLPFPGTRPVVGYAVGTHGLGDQCAPSNKMAAGTEQELTLIKGALDRGWAVVVTDYEGLGTPGDHTYSIGRSEGAAVLDSIRAAIRLPDTGLDAAAPVGVWGYSQGGQAAAWAAQLHPTYAPELRLAGVAAGGVPADLNRVADHLDGSAFFAFLAAAGLGLDAAYPELRLFDHLNDAGRRAFEDGRDDCQEEALPKFAFRRMSDFTTTDVRRLPAWQARIGENRLGGIAPRTPLFLYHALLDEIIPFGIGRTLRQEYCAANVRVRWLVLPIAEHVTGAIEGAPFALAWLRDRLAGRAATTNC